MGKLSICFNAQKLPPPPPPQKNLNLWYSNRVRLENLGIVIVKRWSNEHREVFFFLNCPVAETTWTKIFSLSNFRAL